MGRSSADPVTENGPCWADGVRVETRRRFAKTINPSFFYVNFDQSYDQETPPIQAPPGTLRNVQNYEMDVNYGISTINGYERFDGRPKPSDAAYARLDVTITGTIAVGNTVTGATSAATGVVLAVVTSGAQAYLVITKITGTWQDGENVTVATVVQANTDSVAIIDGASTGKLHAQYKNLAADNYRTDITTVTGSGDILGVKMLNNITYAWRNNAGGTAAALFKSSTSGWTAVALGRELTFTSGGTYQIAEGDTITGAVSGSTAVITRVMLETGTFAAGTAAGRLIFASQSAAFQAENLDVGANLNVATIAGNSSAITLLPDGRYELDIHNFGGQSGTNRIYGADGVNRGFEFDGTIFAPIDTGMDTDTPTHVKAHKGHLFFAFEGSAQHSGTGTPYIFTPVTGASEIAVGDDITEFHVETGSASEAALAIFSRNSTHILYGTSSSNWNLIRYKEEIGAYAHTVQSLAYTILLDDRGVTDLRTSQVYGNFVSSTYTQNIQTFINDKRTKVVDSCIVRDKNQYRLFFSDNYALYITVRGNKVIGIMPILFLHTPTCVYSQEMNDGAEQMMFGSDDGYVYQMDKGTSFDGDNIEAFFYTQVINAKSPLVKKKWMDATFELSGTGYSEFSFRFELNYNSVNTAQGPTVTSTISFSSESWDSGSWDSGFWDSVVLSPESFKLSGTSENISLIVTSTSDYFNTTKFSGTQLRYMARRLIRT